MRRPLVAANWKMYMGKSDTEEFFKDLENYDLDSSVEALICPSMENISLVSEIIDDNNLDIKLGAQNMYYEDSGAYTGETSPKTLKEYGVEYVILGHSERRERFEEDDSFINNKVISAFNNGLTPILCIGETSEQRSDNQYKSIIKAQLSKGINGLNPDEIARLVVAYEPVWAIGTGRNASEEDVHYVVKYIRTLIREFYGECNECVRILYGGSVNPDNIQGFMADEDIDGVLVGGASLEAESFASLVNYGI